MKRSITSFWSIRFIVLILAMALISCGGGGWKETSQYDFLEQIEKRFGILIGKHQVLNAAKGTRGFVFAAKLKATPSLMASVDSSPDKDIDMSIEVDRIDPDFDWWDLQGRMLRYISIQTSQNDGLSLWVDENQEVVYLRVIFFEA